MQEVFEDPQIKHMGMEITIDRADRPALRTVASAIGYSETPAPHPIHPPALGEHTEEVLKTAGYDTAAIDRMRAAGVF